MEEFQYFADPLRFSHLAASGTPCDFCRSTSVSFDAGGFYGTQEVEAICAGCLKSGRLTEIGVTTNEVRVRDLARVVGSEDRARELTREIECCTPALPTWQSREWPFVAGEFPTFVKIASRPDFADSGEFLSSIPEKLLFGRDADEFWDMLPETRITSIADGNYDTSFYLFEHRGGKLCTWDCS